jgi:hypothetical protein
VRVTCASADGVAGGPSASREWRRISGSAADSDGSTWRVSVRKRTDRDTVGRRRLRRVCPGGSANRPGLVERLRRTARPKPPLELRIVLAHLQAMWGRPARTVDGTSRHSLRCRSMTACWCPKRRQQDAWTELHSEPPLLESRLQAVTAGSCARCNGRSLGGRLLGAPLSWPWEVAPR